MENKTKSNFCDKTPEELCRDLTSQHAGGLSVRAEVAGALATVLTAKIVSTIESHERAATKMSDQILCLNIILGIFTIVGTVIAICQLFGWIVDCSNKLELDH